MLDDELFQSNSEMSPPDVRDEDYELMLEDWYDLVGAYSNRKLTILLIGFWPFPVLLKCTAGNLVTSILQVYGNRRSVGLYYGLPLM
jgi:hypothetical protein